MVLRANYNALIENVDGIFYNNLQWGRWDPRDVGATGPSLMDFESQRCGDFAVEN